MIKRLILFLKNQIKLKLLFEVFSVAFLFFLSVNAPKNFWGFFIFLISLFWFLKIYFRYLPQVKRLWFSFFLLPILFFIANFKIKFPYHSLIFSLIFAFTFFLLLGIINFSFKNPLKVYHFFQTFIFILLFLLFFYLFSWSTSSPLIFLFLFLVLTFLFREFLYFDFNFSFQILNFKKIWLISLVIGFLALQIIFFLTFLPFGFINATALIVLWLLINRDFFAAFKEGRLNFGLVMEELTLFILALILIFVTTFLTDRFIYK